MQNEIFNISGNFELDNLTVAQKIIDYAKEWPVSPDYNDYLNTGITRPGQDVRYAIDDSKIKALGWTPKADFDTELKLIVEYYMTNFVW